MDKSQVVEQVHQLKQALLEIEKRLAEAELPLAVLEDFKMAVDHTRLSVWAIMSAQTDQYELASQIARFRVKRAIDMFQYIRSDIDTQELTIDAPELEEFFKALKTMLDRVERFYQSGV